MNSLDSYWTHYFTGVIPEGTSQEAVCEAKRGFYAGVRALLLLTQSRRLLHPLQVGDLLLEWDAFAEDVTRGRQ